MYGAMLACLPERWQTSIAQKNQAYELIVQADEVLFKRGEKIFCRFNLKDEQLPVEVKLHLAKHRYPLHIILPARWVIIRSLSLPLAAKDNLRQAISFEIDRLTPFSPDQVYYDYHILKEDIKRERLSLEVAIVPLKKIDPLINLLTQNRILIDVIRGEQGWEGLNLLPKAARPGLSWRRLLSKSLLSLIILGLLLALLAVPLWQQYQILQDLQDQERRLRKQAKVVMAARERIEKKISQLDKIKKNWQKMPPMVNVLKVLTDLLPDDTSVQHLEIRDGQLIIRGTSEQASALITLFEKAPGFKEPKFLSPVTQRNNREAFNLSVKIERPFPAIKAPPKMKQSADKE